MKNLVKAGRRVSPSQSYSKHPLIPVGEKFGRLEVIENDLSKIAGKNPRRRRFCRCRCNCGVIVIADYSHLKSGHTTSCGCSRFDGPAKIRKSEVFPRIPIGAIYGYWEVIDNRLHKMYGNIRRRSCLVRCQCGTEQIVTFHSLREGQSLSCGCKRKANIDSAWKAFFNMIRCRGWDIHLTLPEVQFVSQLPCAYCGKEPDNLFRYALRRKGKYVYDSDLEIRYSGLDRIDSSKGYSRGNVVPCCWRCNVMKSDYSLDSLFDHLKRVASYRQSPETIRLQASSLFCLENLGDM